MSVEAISWALNLAPVPADRPHHPLERTPRCRNRNNLTHYQISRVCRISSGANPSHIKWVNING